MYDTAKKDINESNIFFSNKKTAKTLFFCQKVLESSAKNELSQLFFQFFTTIFYPSFFRPIIYHLVILVWHNKYEIESENDGSL